MYNLAKSFHVALRTSVVLGCCFSAVAQANPQPIEVEFETYPAGNLSVDALLISPVWYAFHDGRFDTYRIGEEASPEIAEFARYWRQTEPLDNLFNNVQSTGVSGTIDNIDWRLVGFDRSNAFMVQLNPAKHRYFSFVGRLTPSDDGFVGNDDPHAIELFTADGHWKGTRIIDVYGTQVLDAGVLANDEEGIGFLDGHDEGPVVLEDGLVTYHPGYIGSVGNPAPDMTGNVLGGTYTDTSSGPEDFQIEYKRKGTDFTRPNFRVMRIRISHRGLDGYHTGSWYSPERSGEGLSVHVIDRENKRVVVYWFTYAADGSGDQIWMMGVGPDVGSAVDLDMFRYTGGVFGSTDNPDLAMGEKLGRLRLSFPTCYYGSVEFEPVEGGQLLPVSYMVLPVHAPTLGLEDTCDWRPIEGR